MHSGHGALPLLDLLDAVVEATWAKSRWERSGGWAIRPVAVIVRVREGCDSVGWHPDAEPGGAGCAVPIRPAVDSSAVASSSTSMTLRETSVHGSAIVNAVTM